MNEINKPERKETKEYMPDGFSYIRNFADAYWDGVDYGEISGWNNCCDEWESYLKAMEVSVEELLLIIADRHSGNYEEGLKIAKAIHERIYGGDQ